MTSANSLQQMSQFFTFSCDGRDAKDGDDVFLEGVAGRGDDVVASVHDERHLVKGN